MRKLLHITALALMLLTAAQGFAAPQKQGKKSLQNQIAKLEKDISLINAKLEGNRRDSKQALSSLTLVRSKVSTREKLIREYDRTLSTLNDSIRTCEREITALQNRYDTLQRYYARLVRSSYKNRDSRLWYMYVLSSESVGQGLRRFSYLRRFSDNMGQQAARIRETSARLEESKARFSSLRQEADRMKGNAVKERARLQDEEAEASRMVARLNKDGDRYRKQLQDMNRQKQELNRKVSEIIRAEQEAARKKAGGGKKGGGAPKTTVTEADRKLGGEFAANKGHLPWPVEGVITERFGKHMHPVYQNVELPQNNGVTLVVKRGAPVKAIYNGTVTQIVVLPGYNQCVLVSHGTYYTLYTKLRSVAVKSGTKLSTGQQLGTVDTIGGEDLFHFEIWKGSEAQNPEEWLRK
ncbi:MAG: peptidoglycan DD-metalloendopeptidase family protein [Bacteroidales bacterium]|nr:peptidoglycan DD-metalloendopeptidase family protein [Bacteroidales bacterium]